VHDGQAGDSIAMFAVVEALSTTQVTVRSWRTQNTVAGQPPIVSSGAGTWVYIMACPSS
jgi:hypothetical protein